MGKKNDFSKNDAYTFYKSHKDLIETFIPHLILFIIDKLNNKFYDYLSILNLYLKIDLNSIDEISHKTNIEINEVRYQIISIFEDSGLKKIINFTVIFECYIQKNIHL